jgi:hypothetical protein
VWKHGCSGAEGDWVKCGICGEWAHFGCDNRGGLGTFKVTYATMEIGMGNGYVVGESK